MPTSDLIFTIVMGALFLTGCTVLVLVGRAMMRAEQRKREEEEAARRDAAPPPAPPTD